LVVDDYRERVMHDRLVHGCGRVVGLRLGVHRRCSGSTVLIHHTITLPSSVIASSGASALSPSSISLWARPDGIIGKQFSAGSTTQSKITGRSTSIISRM